MIPNAKNLKGKPSKFESGNMKILIIDDDPVCQTLFQLSLKHLGRCDTANCGREAVSAFENALVNNDRYDLITLDIVMPDMNGRESLDAIRNLEKKHSLDNASDAVKVIIVTSMDDPDSFFEAIEDGCEAVAKPVTKKELLEKIRSCFLP